MRSGRRTYGQTNLDKYNYYLNRSEYIEGGAIPSPYAFAQA